MVLPTLPALVNEFSIEASAVTVPPVSGTAPTLAELVDGVRRHYDDGCFACGRANPFGLGIDNFEPIEGGVSAGFVPGPLHRGTFGVLHGGLAVTALDEIMAWAGIIQEGVLCVTASLRVRFRRPVPVEEPLQLRAWMGERSGRRLPITGELHTSSGVAVEASGLYVVAHQVVDLLQT
jgi:acyl-coenzyme A thioesterase PaaI-like protein